jgi:hypothetical protein
LLGFVFERVFIERVFVAIASSPWLRFRVPEAGWGLAIAISTSLSFFIAILTQIPIPIPFEFQIAIAFSEARGGFGI